MRQGAGGPGLRTALTLGQGPGTPASSSQRLGPTWTWARSSPAVSRQLWPGPEWVWGLLPAPAFPKPLAKQFLGAESIALRVWPMETQVTKPPSPSPPQPTPRESINKQGTHQNVPTAQQESHLGCKNGPRERPGFHAQPAGPARPHLGCGSPSASRAAQQSLWLPHAHPQLPQLSPVLLHQTRATHL